MTKYVQEQEVTMEHTREKIRETERAVSQQLEHHRMLEATIEQLQQDNADLRRTTSA